MKRLVPLALLLVAACSGRSGLDVVSVEDAWVRLPAIAGRPGAGYFTLTGGKAPTRLVAVESTSAARIELHESMGAGGMAGMSGMRPLTQVNVPPGAPVPFRPGGNHAMIFGIKPEVQPGGRMPLSFRFADGSRVEAEAQVIGAGDPAP
ncbi:copper chaperone PCu(A)C [Sphingomonas jatrophae]|nr:copper chaperone PCu(A)C [Sphingomonas jatrophae]